MHSETFKNVIIFGINFVRFFVLKRYEHETNSLAYGDKYMNRNNLLFNITYVQRLNGMLIIVEF